MLMAIGPSLMSSSRAGTPVGVHVEVRGEEAAVCVALQHALGHLAGHEQLELDDVQGDRELGEARVAARERGTCAQQVLTHAEAVRAGWDAGACGARTGGHERGQLDLGAAVLEAGEGLWVTVTEAAVARAVQAELES
jgi:hypothetical protein